MIEWQKIPIREGQLCEWRKGQRQITEPTTETVLPFLLREIEPLFRLPPIRHPIGFFASLGESEVSRGIPSGTLKNLLTVGIPPQASLELKGHNFLFLCLFLQKKGVRFSFESYSFYVYFLWGYGVFWSVSPRR